METMVDRYQTELLPVAAELTARLVRNLNTPIGSIRALISMSTNQCETYTRLARESIAAEEAADSKGVDLDRLMDETGEDKIFAAMGVAKTITTVSIFTSVKRNN